LVRLGARLGKSLGINQLLFDQRRSYEFSLSKPARPRLP
jgi:hypothetical protein